MPSVFAELRLHDSFEELGTSPSLLHIRRAADVHTRLVRELTDSLYQLSRPLEVKKSNLLHPRQRKLRKILLQPPFALVKAIVAVQAASSHSDNVLHALVHHFDTEGMLLPLFEAVVYQEVLAASGDQTTLFRGESPCTRMMSVLFATQAAVTWLRQLVQPFLETLVANNIGLEIDPKKLNGTSESGRTMSATEHGLQLVRLTQDLLDHLKTVAAHTCPPIFRLLFAVMRRCIRVKFPQMELLSIGSFLFLRFLSPAIVTPQKYGLITSRISAQVSRTCMLVVKLIQALANGVTLDGSKEEYMNFQQANDLINSNQDDVRLMLEDLSVQPHDIDSYFPYTNFLQPREDADELAIIEEFIGSESSKIITKLRETPELLPSVLNYVTAADPFILRSIVQGYDRLSPLHSLISKLADSVRSAISNQTLYVSAAPLASTTTKLLTTTPNFRSQFLWQTFHHRLDVLLTGLVELLRFWPSHTVEIQLLERRRYICSQLCFIDHLLKSTFRSMIPTESQRELSVWLSLFNLLRSTVFFAVHKLESEPHSVQQSLVLATSQLRWTAAAIFGYYFPHHA